MESIKRESISKTSDEISEAVVKAGLERIRACFQCGTCTGGCPSGRRTALRTRAVIRKALLGLEEVLSSDDIWLCSTCYTCYSRCPRNIPVTNIIIMLRNLATQKGYIKASHQNLTHMLIDTGHGVPIPEGSGGEKWRKLRESYDLPPLPPTVHSDPRSLEEVRKLCKSLKFDKLVKYKKE
ncbi:MAG: CoB--CoM heterodisulfide reductase subunit C [Candidatus Helarchaeota archaeon]